MSQLQNFHFLLTLLIIFKFFERSCVNTRSMAPEATLLAHLILYCIRSFRVCFFLAPPLPTIAHLEIQDRSSIDHLSVDLFMFGMSELESRTPSHAARRHKTQNGEYCRRSILIYRVGNIATAQKFYRALAMLENVQTVLTITVRTSKNRCHAEGRWRNSALHLVSKAWKVASVSVHESLLKRMSRAAFHISHQFIL